MKLIIIYISIILQITDLTLGGVLECAEDVDCLAADATCVNELCECPAQKTLSYDGSKCLQLAVGFEASCEEDVQCGWLLGKYRCSNGNCVCAEGWRYYQGKCLEAKGLGAVCSKNEDCFVSNDLLAMICTGGRCRCNVGYYERGNYDCRPIGQPGDNCALDSDCQFENGFCSMSMCAVRTDNIEESLRKSDKLQEEHSIDLYEIGTSCVGNDQCEEPNSFCSPITKTCTCKRGYFYQNSRYGCVAELGTLVGCTEAADCSIKPSRCVDGACHCTLSNYYGQGNNKCTKVAFTPDFACTNDLGCLIMGPHAICVEENILESYCKCPKNMEFDEIDSLCKTTDGGQCASCVVTADCVALVNSVCVRGVCECSEYDTLVGEICLPNIGGKCSEEFECLIEHTYCQEETNVCVCEENYIADGKLSCLERVAGLNSECEADVQCTAEVGNSECKDGICTCVDEFLEQDGSCIVSAKSMGEYCVAVTQCYGTQVQCRNNICQCSAEMEPTADRLDCKLRSNSATSISLQLLLLTLTFYII